MKPTVADVRNALIPVEDPEMGLSVVDLGLIRDMAVEEEGRRIRIAMTFTTPACPYGPELLAAVKRAAGGLNGVEEVQVDLVWNPPWDPHEDASDTAKDAMGIWTW